MVIQYFLGIPLGIIVVFLGLIPFIPIPPGIAYIDFTSGNISTILPAMLKKFLQFFSQKFLQNLTKVYSLFSKNYQKILLWIPLEVSPILPDILLNILPKKNVQKFSSFFLRMFLLFILDVLQKLLLWGFFRDVPLKKWYEKFCNEFFQRCRAGIRKDIPLNPKMFLTTFLKKKIQTE